MWLASCRGARLSLCCRHGGLSATEESAGGGAVGEVESAGGDSAGGGEPAAGDNSGYGGPAEFGPVSAETGAVKGAAREACPSPAGSSSLMATGCWGQGPAL